MAIISGQSPTPAAVSDPPKRRVVVKFKPHVQMPYSQEAVSRMDAPASALWRNLAAAHPGIELVPYFSTLGEVGLRGLAQRKPRIRGATTPAAFTQYYGVTLPPGGDPEAAPRVARGALPLVIRRMRPASITSEPGRISSGKIRRALTRCMAPE